MQDGYVRNSYDLTNLREMTYSSCQSLAQFLEVLGCFADSSHCQRNRHKTYA